MRVAVSWSGGKESCLAYHRAVAQGHEVDFLLTFILNDWPSLCHPISMMRLQSEALGIRHLTFKVRKPYMDGYRNVIANLAREEGIQGIVTGDIWIDDHRRWIENVCSGLSVIPIMPLWGNRAAQLLDEVVSDGFKPVFTCVKEPWFDEKWLSRRLDRECIVKLEDLHRKFGIDLCGENGEYHTMVLDGPMFREAIQIEESGEDKKNSTLFLRVHRLSLQHKTA
jgi:uncharacterized protein (TIGR00290 family)